MKKTLIAGIGAFVLGLGLVGAVFAQETIRSIWKPIWHGTAWIKDGVTIEAQKVAENFEYLYRRIPTKETCENGSLLRFNAQEDRFECLKCEPGAKLRWTDEGVSCFLPKGCKIRYKVKNGTNETDWIETDWGGKNNGDWVFGEEAVVRGYSGQTQFRVGIFCDEGITYTLRYKYRGNRGPYHITGAGYTEQTTITSKPNTWVDGGWTTAGYSCAVKGGDGVCGAYVHEVKDEGEVTCDVAIRTVNKETNGYGILVNGDPNQNERRENVYGSMILTSHGGILMGVRCQ